MTIKSKIKSRIVILGAGESGVGAAILAHKKGFDVFVSDSGKIKQNYKEALTSYKIKWEESGHSEEMILNASEIIKSPGIPDKAPVVKHAKEKGIPIVSEIEFAGRYTDAKKICITGSNGKTTTTLLIYDMLQKEGLNVGLAGNVGKSFAWQVAESNYDIYVIELSSFQLDDMYRFKADVGILMNITPDHLDRYGYEFQNYINSKFRIVQNMTKDEYFIYCHDDDVIKKELTKRKIPAQMVPFSIKEKVQEGAYIENDKLEINFKNTQFTMFLHDLALQGKHNTYNSMAAGLTGNVFRIRKEVIRKSLSEFQGVEHRLEPVLRVKGIEYINDSKATNVNSTWYALETMTGKVIWIVGGIDKGNDYTMLHSLVKEKVKAIIYLGVDNTKIHAAFDGIVLTQVEATSMEDAVKKSYYLGRKGDTVLLSPACASFDLFDNYEDRGRQFKNAVRNL